MIAIWMASMNARKEKANNIKDIVKWKMQRFVNVYRLHIRFYYNFVFFFYCIKIIPKQLYFF